MPDNRPDVQHQQNAAISAGLQQFSTLPDWLASIKDSHRTRQVLARAIPEFVDGSMLLKKVRIGHMLLIDHYWQSLCMLKISIAGERMEKTIELNGKLFPPGAISIDQPVVEGCLGTEGWHAILPELNLELSETEPETALEAFDLLTDPEKSRAFLEDHLRGASPAYRELHIQACRPDVVRYKPGNRCTILYHLEYGPDMPGDAAFPAVVVGKTYLQEKGQRAYESMRALWNTPFGSSQVVHMAEPLAYHPDLRVFIQGAVREEQTLADFIPYALHAGTPQAYAQLNEILRKTAVGLAELHQSNVNIGQPVTWADELAEVQEQVRQLAAVFPHLKPAADLFLERLCQLEAETPAGPLVPSHGTFRPAQVLLYKGEISFIDFDSFCQSEPARDLAFFLSTLRMIGLTPSSFDHGKDPAQTIANEATWQARFAFLSSICDRFLEVYEQHHPVSRQRVALWEALNLFYTAMRGWAKVKVDETAYLVKLLDNFSRRLFSQR